MKTLTALALVSFLALFAGCGSESEEGAVDAAAPADACVQAQGNCGCVLFQDIKYVDNVQVSTSHLVCPGDDH